MTQVSSEAIDKAVELISEEAIYMLALPLTSLAKIWSKTTSGCLASRVTHGHSHSGQGLRAPVTARHYKCICSIIISLL